MISASQPLKFFLGSPTAMVDFFIRRPIFATVSAVLMLLIGGICAI